VQRRGHPQTNPETTATSTPRARRCEWHPQPIPPTKKAYSVHEFGAALGLSRPSVYKLIESGQARTVHVGRRGPIPASEIDRVLNGAT